jgi:hypothetical protein
MSYMNAVSRSLLLVLLLSRTETDDRKSFTYLYTVRIYITLPISSVFYVGEKGAHLNKI